MFYDHISGSATDVVGDRDVVPLLVKEYQRLLDFPLRNLDGITRSQGMDD